MDTYAGVLSIPVVNSAVLSFDSAAAAIAFFSDKPGKVGKLFKADDNINVMTNKIVNLLKNLFI
jgi:hypothetical protein